MKLATFSLVALLWAATPAAQAADAFVAPRVPPAYGEALSKLPDFNGSWLATSANTNLLENLMFDPANIHVQPDPGGEHAGTDFGPVPGTYLTGIPFKPEFAKAYRQSIQNAIEGKVEDDVANCRPYGMPRIMSGAPGGPEIIMTPSMILMSLYGGETRRIYIDGRPHISGDDYLHSWHGHSIGKWKGDTLVVDTVAIYPGNYDQSNARHSDQIRVVERIRLVSKDLLENQITITDPVMLERPWTVTRRYKRGPVAVPNTLSTQCSPENGIDMSSGFQNIILPTETDPELGAGVAK